ncbi:MAG: N-succinylarginine dihydrolase [Tepidisphaeraceae bacterium]
MSATKSEIPAPPTAIEVNFDGIVGPTHSYAGLSVGNLASQRHINLPSNPRQAALQGLAKMKLLADMGIKQAVLPPHHRPDLSALRRLGFTGSDSYILEQAAKDQPHLLAACASASAMWVANAATVSPSADSFDGKVHFTPANLVTLFHRSLETPTTAAVLRTIFSTEHAFAHHPPLPANAQFADEGAANHMRLAPHHGAPGIQIFVFGRSASAPSQSHFPARQTAEASMAIARLHKVRDPRMLQQNPAAIDAGAFHNDVLAVANLNVVLYHASAWPPPDPFVAARAQWFAPHGEFHHISVSEQEIPLADAVSSYLFNSQIVGTDKMTLIAPTESRDTPTARRFLEELPHRNTPIREVKYVDIRQSMNNGGGPACLRLRVVLTHEELDLIRPRVFLDDALYTTLVDWVTRNYRDHLLPADLADPKLLDESRQALDELTQVLGLGSIYPFQRQ